MYFFLILRILSFLYYKSRIFTSSHDSYIIFKRVNFLNIIKKFRHPLTPIIYNNYKRLEYGNNFLWPSIDKICYENKKKIPVTIPNEKKCIEFNDIKIYEKDDIVLKIKFNSSFSCNDIDFFLKKTENEIELENGFEYIIEKIIISEIEKQNFGVNNNVSQFTKIFKEKTSNDNDNETNNEKAKTTIWTYINSVLQSSVLSNLKITSSNTQIVSMNVNMNGVISF